MSEQKEKIPLPAPTKVEDFIIERTILIEDYIRPETAPTLTICLLILKNGFVAVGTSACVSPSEFDAKKGEELAYADAFEEVRHIMSYQLLNILQGETDAERKRR